MYENCTPYTPVPGVFISDDLELSLEAKPQPLVLLKTLQEIQADNPGDILIHAISNEGLAVSFTELGVSYGFGGVLGRWPNGTPLCMSPDEYEMVEGKVQLAGDLGEALDVLVNLMPALFQELRNDPRMKELRESTAN